MDKYIEQSIKSRKDAIFAVYEVEGESLKKVEKLFSEMEKLGASCGDVGEFETKFATSPLNQQYMDLFTEIAMNSTAKTAVPKTEKGGIGKMVAGGVAVGVAESAMDRAIGAVVPTRAAVHQKAYDEVRKVPGLGDAIDVSEKVGYAMHLSKLFKKKKKD